MSELSDLTVYALPDIPEGYCLFAVKSSADKNYNFVIIDKDSKKATLIDFCLDNNEAATLWDNLENHGIAVSEICFTHTHRDHCNETLYPFLKKQLNPFLGSKNFTLPNIFMADDSHREPSSNAVQLQNFYDIKNAERFHFLSDKKQPAFLKFVLTAEHAPDHCVYRLGNIIFSGDERAEFIPNIRENTLLYPACALFYQNSLQAISLQELLNQHFGLPPKRIAYVQSLLNQEHHPLTGKVFENHCNTR